MSLLDHITFDTAAPPPDSDALRMDIPLFVGHLAARGPVALDSALGQWWVQQGYLNAADRRLDAVLPYDCPVPVASLQAVLAQFTDTRVDQVARVSGSAPDGSPLNGTLLSVVVDGTLRSLELRTADIEVAAAQMALAWPDLEITFDGAFHIALPAAHGAGTLSVLAHPGLGFAETGHATARAAGNPVMAALAEFFARGGQQAYVVSMGPPVPLFAADAARDAAVSDLIAAQGLTRSDPALALRQTFAAPQSERHELHGVNHLLGLEDASFLVMPELQTLCAPAPVEAPEAPHTPSMPTRFAPCVVTPSKGAPQQLANLAMPALTQAGLDMWQGAVTRCLDLIAAHRRDVLMLAACPRVAAGVALPDAPRSAFLQLTDSFVRTPRSAGLPGAVMGADAVLVGQIAARLVGNAPYQSAALAPLSDVLDVVPARANLPLCSIDMSARRVGLKQDVTTSGDTDWRFGTSSRLAARLIRMARVYGETLVFEPMSDALMREVKTRFERLLQQVALAGGLSPGREDPGFTVICDRTVNTQAELDQGRLRAEIAFRPTAPIGMIRIQLPIGAGGRA